MPLNCTRPRPATRHLMIAVAVIALTLGAALSIVRLSRFSTDYAQVADRYEAELVELSSTPSLFQLSPPARARRRAWCEAMIAKYHSASRHPWSPLAPDPPEPPGGMFGHPPRF